MSKLTVGILVENTTVSGIFFTTTKLESCLLLRMKSFRLHFRYLPPPKRPLWRSLGTPGCRRRRARLLLLFRLKGVAPPLVLDAEEAAEQRQNGPPPQRTAPVLVAPATVHYGQILVVVRH